MIVLFEFSFKMLLKNRSFKIVEQKKYISIKTNREIKKFVKRYNAIKIFEEDVYNVDFFK